MIKALERAEIKGSYINIIKKIYNKLSFFSPWQEIQNDSAKIRNKANCPLSPYLFNIVIEVLGRAIRHQKKIRGI